MAMPQFSMRELIEAGVHFGHKTKRWNPRMAPYLYGVRNDVHIIDLQKTVPLLHKALQEVRAIAAKNGRILFVGTKRQAQQPLAEEATRCGQHYINQRWLGGMLTNWNTIQNSIKTLRKMEEQLEGNTEGLTKKEVLSMQRQKEKLEKSLGGIKNMGGLPDMIFIIDTIKEDLAIKEAQRLGIPIIAIIDSNSSPEGITYPIPGNDDAGRAIQLYCRLFSDAILDGIQEAMARSGTDMGAAEEVKTEDLAAFETAQAEESAETKKGTGGPVVVKKPMRGEKIKKHAGQENAESAEAASEAKAEMQEEKTAADADKIKPGSSKSKSSRAKKA